MSLHLAGGRHWTEEVFLKKPCFHVVHSHTRHGMASRPLPWTTPKARRSCSQWCSRGGPAHPGVLMALLDYSHYLLSVAVAFCSTACQRVTGYYWCHITHWQPANLPALRPPPHSAYATPACRAVTALFFPLLPACAFTVPGYATFASLFMPTGDDVFYGRPRFWMPDLTLFPLILTVLHSLSTTRCAFPTRFP